MLPDLPLNPKPVANSWLMSRAQLTGQFTFTYEANINILAPDYTIPATICHELAHTRGFMREDEANFIAYLGLPWRARSPRCGIAGPCWPWYMWTTASMPPIPSCSPS